MQNGKADVFRFCVSRQTLAWVILLALFGIGLMVFGLLKPNIKEPRVDESFVACRHNLCEIGNAMAQFYRATGNLPPACIRDNQGKPLLSGRVLLMPYLGGQDVYDRVNQHEPWDSEENRLALRSGTDLARHFHCPSDHRAKYGDTSYVFVADCRIRLPAEGSWGEPIEGLPRDETNTVMMIEVANWGINWAEPRDAGADDIRRMIRQHGIASPHPVMMSVLLRDGRVVSHHASDFEMLINRFIDNASENAGDRASRGSGSGRSAVHN